MLEKLKNLLNRLFNKKTKLLEENYQVIEDEHLKLSQNLNEKDYIKNKRLENIKHIDREILKLQLCYENNQISEQDLTINQIRQLISLYKKQINTPANKL